MVPNSVLSGLEAGVPGCDEQKLQQSSRILYLCNTMTLQLALKITTSRCNSRNAQTVSQSCLHFSQGSPLKRGEFNLIFSWSLWAGYLCFYWWQPQAGRGCEGCSTAVGHNDELMEEAQLLEFCSKAQLQDAYGGGFLYISFLLSLFLLESWDKTV